MKENERSLLSSNSEAEQEQVYIEPNIEHELSKEKRQECRDIVKEIKNFGVNQRQILFLIQLLSMELENGDLMRALVKTIGTIRSSIPVGKKLILSTDSNKK